MLSVNALLETVGVKTPRNAPIMVIDSLVVSLRIVAGPTRGPVTSSMTGEYAFPVFVTVPVPDPGVPESSPAIVTAR
jgi:hypothetical protein